MQISCFFTFHGILICEVLAYNWLWWCIVPVTQEAEEGESLEPRVQYELGQPSKTVSLKKNSSMHQPCNCKIHVNIH
jgi:hypothetical protein